MVRGVAQAHHHGWQFAATTSECLDADWEGLSILCSTALHCLCWVTIKQKHICKVGRGQVSTCKACLTPARTLQQLTSAWCKQLRHVQ